MDQDERLRNFALTPSPLDEHVSARVPTRPIFVVGDKLYIRNDIVHVCFLKAQQGH